MWLAGTSHGFRAARLSATNILRRVRPEHTKKLRKAKEALSQDSNLLRAQKRATSQIAACKSAEEVLSVVGSTRPQELNEISLSASITRIAQLQPQNLASQQQQTPTFEALLERLDEYLRNPAVQHVSVASVLWAIAASRENIPEFQKLLPAAVLGLESSVHKMREREITNSIWAVATLHTYVPESRSCLKIDSVCELFAGQPRTFGRIRSVQAVGNALWALGRLRNVAPPRLQEQLEPVLLARCREILACDVFQVDRTVRLSGVARVAWALALLERPDEGILGRVRHFFVESAGTCSGSRLLPFVDVLCALAKLNMTDGGLVEVVAARPWSLKSMRDWESCLPYKCT